MVPNPISNPNPNPISNPNPNPISNPISNPNPGAGPITYNSFDGIISTEDMKYHDLDLNKLACSNHEEEAHHMDSNHVFVIPTIAQLSNKHVAYQQEDEDKSSSSYKSSDEGSDDEVARHVFESRKAEMAERVLVMEEGEEEGNEITSVNFGDLSYLLSR